MNSSPDLITIGDEPYFTTISKSVEQFEEIYPDGHIHIYNWGFTQSQRKQLQSYDSTSLLPWDFRNKWRGHVLKIGEIFGQLIPIDFDLSTHARNKVSLEQKEWFLYQKPYVMYDCLGRISNGPLIFLDGDAILNNRLPALERDDFDIGVTLRPHHEIEAARQRGDYHVLNSGVIMWNCTPEKGRKFVKAWIKRMQACDLSLQEQSSLAKLIEEACADIYEEFGNRCQMNIDGKNITIEIFDCREYNYNWVEEGWSPKNRVLHFKSGRFEDIEKYMSDI